MTWMNKGALGLIVLLSLAAGLAKVLSAPEEVAFLQSNGLSNGVIWGFGACQVLAALAMCHVKFRQFGVGLAALTFSFSTVLIGLSGNLVFGFVSLLPVALCFYVFNFCANANSNKSPDDSIA